MLGGRNLTGRRLQAATSTALRNPFVRELIDWAMTHQLADPRYRVESEAVKKYLSDGQDHLAFSYLLQTRWFREHGQRFSGDPACHRFQAMVFYFFGALFYHLGLTLRSLGGEADPVPHLVLLAGNGSQYLHWLTDLTPPRATSVFHASLGRLLLRGLDAPADAAVPRVQLTTEPKREVALGLVAAVPAGKLREEGAALQPVVGEAITARLSSSGQPRMLDATSRFAAHDLLEPDHVASLAWMSSPMEIERFHHALQAETRDLAEHGAQWNDIASGYRRFFGETLDPRSIQHTARTRLQYLANSGNGFRGSLFILEAATVLDRMMSTLFESDDPALPRERFAGIQVRS
jgi:hypothetical protein